MDQFPTPAAVLSHLRAVSSSSPRLVWYGPDGRIELSGRVLDNWVAKTANLLVDELDAAAGTRIELDLPVHWKSLVWALAGWQVGAAIVPRPGDGARQTLDERPDIVVTAADRGAGEPAALLVAVALGALAMRWPAPLPPGAVDYAAEVRSHGDVFSDAVPQDARTVLFTAGLAPEGQAPGGQAPGPLTVEGLHRLAAAAPDPGSVVLLQADTTLRNALAAALAVWTADGTLILVHPEVEVTQSLLDGERVTARMAFPPARG
jgi:uncharacterized protein (TIGR03089 family)